jgi:hypothetical protein
MYGLLRADFARSPLADFPAVLHGEPPREFVVV